MSTSPIVVPRLIDRKLNAVRGREQAMRVLSGALVSTTLFCVLLLGAMAVDWLSTPFSLMIRVLITLTALICGTLGAAAYVLRPLLIRPSMPHVAGMVEASVPQLEERWTTITDLSNSHDPPEVRGSSILIGQVAHEAEHLGHLVDPLQVVSPRRLKSNANWLVGALAVMLCAWLVDASQMSVLWQRFWRPTSEISLTKVTTPDMKSTVPKFESTTIIARLENRIRREATIWIRDDAGHVSKLPMVPVANQPENFAFHLSSVERPFEFRVRAGDGQSPWQQVAIAERPRIESVDFQIIPPAYSRLPIVQQNGLPRRSRALAESRLRLSIQASEPLKELRLVLSDQTSIPVVADVNGVFHFEQELKDDLSFTVQMVSQHGLKNEKPPTCQIVTYADQFPTVNLTSPLDDVVVRPDDKIAIEFTAKDDFGIAKAELVVKDETNPDAEPLQVIEIPLGNQQGEPEVQGKMQLDLKDLKLKRGAQLSYSVRVFDTKDSSAVGDQMASKDRKPASNHNSDPKESHDATAKASPPSSSASSADTSNQDPAQKSETENATAESAPAETRESDQIAKADDTNPAQDQNPGQPKSDQSSQSSASSPSQSTASTKPNESKDEETPQVRQEIAPRPADSMTRRNALGQCSSCRPKSLKIDEWAGSFEGQMREKLEIAIEDFLQRLDAALSNGELENRTLIDQFAKNSAWDQSLDQSVRKAVGHLTKASEVAVELASKSSATPYAFMALQLAEIDERHMSRATTVLREVAKAEPDRQAQDLQVSFTHIRRAREMLAKLTRTYEGVKVNHQLADAMEHIKKMHQVFLEDSFKLLGNSRPTINPQNRKFLELDLDDEFRRKLKELLEKKRDIQAQLAKLLAEDPNLLRRFMAQTRLDADSLRDQMTINARKQDQLQQEHRAFAAAKENPADADIGQIWKTRLVEEADEIRQATATMSENFETWLPKDLNQDEKFVRSLRQQLEQLTVATQQLEAKAATNEEATAEAKQVYDLLQTLEADLSSLADEHPDLPKLMTHVTNRLVEAAKLTTLVSGWITKAKAFQDKQWDTLALVDQSRLTNDTAEMTNKIGNLRSWMSGLSPDIAQMAKEMSETLENELLVEQVAVEELLAEHQLNEAIEHQGKAIERFATAEQQFDVLLKAIIAHLDAQPVNTKPSLDGVEPESIEELLAMLEDEKLAAEGLGIPCCRPNNLSIVKDWMSPSKGNMGGMMASGAQAQAQNAQRMAGQFQKAAVVRKKRLTDAAVAAGAEAQNAGRGRHVNPRWNTLASKLDDGLKQVRGQSPPEKYRSAIEHYFEMISGGETTPAPKK
ncbi:hypothetical protein [Schlesneria paludicola]|uniref:hypothetical protein n=1 Tax=Schlesneria paludicola TaxID=360056 RepID=UPI00029A2B08|nr:hypothetical protein [Schlesneria paludicola]